MGIYANESLSAEERTMEFGTFFQVAMGEKGRGRKLMALTCPEETVLKEGMTAGYRIGKTRSGKPRISRGDDGELYLMLSAGGAYTRRDNGVIFIPESHAADWKLLASGNGADGDAGRIGFWECALLKAPKYDSVVFVHSSRCGYGDPEDLYVTHENRAYRCTAETLDECCEALGIPVPLDIRLSEKTGTIALKGWSRACWLP